MKKFAENMVFCGAAFALLVALTASDAQAQNYSIRKPEPIKPNPVQVPKVVVTPQKGVPQLPPPTYSTQQHPFIAPAVVPVTAVKPVGNPHWPGMVTMPNNNHHVVNMPPVRYEPPRFVHPVVPAGPVMVNPPHVRPEPPRTVIVEQPKVIIVEPRKTLLEKLFDKIF